MSKINIFDLLDVPEDIGGEISENCPKIDTDRTEALIRSAIGGTGAAQAPAKKRPLRRRFMIGLVAAVVSAAVIGGAVAVVAQNNGNYIEPLSDKEAAQMEIDSHYNPPGEQLVNERKAFEAETEQAAKELFYKKHGYRFEDLSKDEVTEELYHDFEMQGAFYRAQCNDNMITKFINDGYGDISILPEKPAHDYFDYSDERWNYIQDLDKYSDIIMTICKAYNDMDYELTEREKMLTYDYLDNAHYNIREYANQHNYCTDKMRQAYEMIGNTIVPSYNIDLNVSS